ncbi:MAG: AAA family ATPase, partial [Dehalococcoidia bacterium]|nr:AAA family ATPase [Dehalococcoidia bacterium]
MTEKQTYTSYQTEEYVIKEEPFYLPVGDEVELFEVAYSQQLPILLKGPTGT